MLKIRLMRIGTKGHPFYRIVVVDERKKRTGAYIDLIGTYNPLSQPKEIKINQEKVDEWTKKGAQMSTGFMRIIGKAPKKLEGKVKNPGKLRSNTPAAPVEEAPAEETATEEVPSENEAPTEEVAQDQEVEQAEVTETPETEEVVAENAPVEETPAEESTETSEEEGKE